MTYLTGFEYKRQLSYVSPELPLAPNPSEWTLQSYGYNGTSYVATDPSATATYQFTGLTEGQQYEVLATWIASSANSPAASYSLSNNGAAPTTYVVNQTLAPLAEQTKGRAKWQVLCTFTASGGSASVTIHGPTDGTQVTADGVEIQAAGPITQFTYDKAGDLLSQTDPLGNVTTFSYDSLGRETMVNRPQPGNGSAGGPATSYVYDLVGNLLSTTSPSPAGSGNVTTFNVYDQQNNLVGSQDAKGNMTTYARDPLGNVLSLTDSDGNTTAWNYDHLGQVTSQTAPAALGYYADGTVRTTTAANYNFYDQAGNLTTSIDADGRAIVYGYDSLNRETGQTWYDATGATVTGTVSTGYDSLGRVQSLSNTVGPSTPVASYSYWYDLANRPLTENVQLGGVSTNVALQTSYDYK